MRRKANKDSAKYHATVGDIKNELSQRQLAAIGAVAMYYNEMEAWIDTLFWQVTELPSELELEVSTRINGIDGKLEIIKIGASSLDLAPPTLNTLRDTLGESGFVQLRKFRDAVIHARVLNAPLGLGARVDRRASVYEVLLTADALEILTEHIFAMRLELQTAANLLIAARIAKSTDSAGPEKAQLEAGKSTLSAQLREHRNRTKSLRPLPEFPSESELIAARALWYRDQQEAISDWIRKVVLPEQPKDQ